MRFKNISFKSIVNVKSFRLGLATTLAVCCSANFAAAGLGGFEASDGYVDVGQQPTFDVGQYNAGLNPGTDWTQSAYPEGTNNPEGKGWKKLTGSPRMPHNSGAPGNAYATSHSTNPFQGVTPRTGDRALMITTNNQGWLGEPQRYSYQVVAEDLMDQTGTPVEPSITDNSVVKISFWSCSQLLGLDEVSATGQRKLPGGLPAGSFGNSISFIDSLGQGGVKVGYSQPGTTTDNFAYDLGNGWVTTDHEVDPTAWHKWEVELDLRNDLASISIQLSDAAAPIPLLTRQPMATPMSGSFKEMIFSSTGGPDNTAQGPNGLQVAGKLWTLDDFQMSVPSVPEPNSSVLAIFAALGLLAYRRR